VIKEAFLLRPAGDNLTSGDRKEGTRVPGSTADPEVAAQIAARTKASAQRRRDFAAALLAQVGTDETERLLQRYPQPLEEISAPEIPLDVAVADLLRIDALPAHEMRTDMRYAHETESGEQRLRLFSRDRILLSDILPLLAHLGIEVTDEHTHVIVDADGVGRFVYDIGLQSDLLRHAAEPETAGRQLREAFDAAWAGTAVSDGFTALVLRAGLTWRQVAVLRAYAAYLHQAGTPYSRSYVASCLVAHASLAGRLVELFEARFDPALGAGDSPSRTQRMTTLTDDVLASLDEVAALDEDRILRGFFRLIAATQRTNYYRTDSDPSVLVLKIDAKALPALPEPRPYAELFVCSPRVEGVHLRFGRIARGGLRWSDRREDYRTEVLGLVKAQAVKNAVIVPVGAKGGFVVLRPPAAAEELRAEGVVCYRIFVTGLLSVTDNLIDGKIEPPTNVVRYDSDDPYLVVAADKGTAAFSDIANEIALEHGFWLGDAFASGGSAGYDHKVMGITARGAWESVRRHFRELGLDPQVDEFTAVGIGDMSGDVFGNGMLLSDRIRLVAAFDHRHVFLDPDPDPATSYAERQRLFALPRSSWEDYNPDLISAGGGVYARSAKSVPISDAVRSRLGLAPEITELTPPALLQAILQAPVDLLWNGGIGTYVKARTETSADVGDKANDAIRVDGHQVRARVVGEGGNLGFTQRGRIEYALAGGRLNTDAIDNSAGVDTSDREVNIKILLDGVVRSGDLSGAQRDELLASMTDDVAALVLRDNIAQNLALSIERAEAPATLGVHRRFLHYLEQHGGLDRELEALPDDDELDQRAEAGPGLTSPELAVLLAYAKNTLAAQLLDSDLADPPWFDRLLRDALPQPLVERYGDRLANHPLRQEIIVAVLVNDLVNRGGATFAFRAQEETGAGPAEIARAYVAVREVFAVPAWWDEIETVAVAVPTDAQVALFGESRRLVDRAARWFLQTRRSRLDVATESARFAGPVAAFMPRLAEMIQAEERDRVRRVAGAFVELGAPQPQAYEAAVRVDAFSLLDIVEVAEAVGCPLEKAAEVYFALSERLHVDMLLTRISALDRTDRWNSLARTALRFDLYNVLAHVTRSVVSPAAGGGAASAAAAIDRWETASAEGLGRVEATVADVAQTGTWNLASLSVALRAMRSLGDSTGPKMAHRRSS
jgi:glutamate dehydrogenase